MATLVGLENSNFDAYRYRVEMTDPTICPHCGKSSHDPVRQTGTTFDLGYDEDALKAAIDTDTLDFGLNPDEWDI